MHVNDARRRRRSSFGAYGWTLFNAALTPCGGVGPTDPTAVRERALLEFAIAHPEMVTPEAAANAGQTRETRTQRYGTGWGCTAELALLKQMGVAPLTNWESYFSRIGLGTQSWEANSAEISRLTNTPPPKPKSALDQAVAVVRSIPAAAAAYNPLTLTFTAAAQTGLLGSSVKKKTAGLYSWMEHNPAETVAIQAAVVGGAFTAAGAAGAGVIAAGAGLATKAIKYTDPPKTPTTAATAADNLLVAAPANAASAQPAGGGLLGPLVAGAGMGFLAGGPVGAILGGVLGGVFAKKKG